MHSLEWPLAHTKSLKDSRYECLNGQSFLAVRTHKLLKFFTHRPTGRLAQTDQPVPSGLVFRVDGRDVLECFYYEQHEDDLYSGDFIDLLTDTPSFIDEKLFEPPVPGIDPEFMDNGVRVTLYGKKRMFVYCCDWGKKYQINAPPTVKELLETMIVEAHYNLDDDWGRTYRHVFEES
ncbi:hypothetical protein TWF730_005801 [Orbilia blumenaviensis]|uniref:Uncharacterized protein n=1 Tax=Orbilia blumenaviensis TaxID=1796055 RepID=A0AAV9VJT9_9PEZI